MPHSKLGTKNPQEGVAPSEILISLEAPVAHTRDERVSTPIAEEGAAAADPAPLSDGTDEGLAIDQETQATTPIRRTDRYNNLFALSPAATSQTPDTSEAIDYAPTDGYESDGPLMF